MRTKLRVITFSLRLKEYYGQVLLMTSLGLLFVSSAETSDITLTMFGVLLACCGLFMFNNIEDARDDALLSAKKNVNPVSMQILNIKRAKVITFSSLTFASVLFYKVSFYTGLIGLGMIFIGLLYSWKSVRLKALPIIDIVSHALVASLAFVLGSSIGGFSFSPNYVFMFFAIFTLSAVGDINNEIRDYDVDRLAGIKNTASIFNFETIKPLLSLMTIIASLYIYFSIFFWLNANLKILLLVICVVFALDILLVTKRNGIQVYDYPRRNFLYFCVSLVICFNVLFL